MGCRPLFAEMPSKCQWAWKLRQRWVPTDCSHQRQSLPTGVHDLRAGLPEFDDSVVILLTPYTTPPPVASSAGERGIRCAANPARAKIAWYSANV